MGMTTLAMERREYEDDHFLLVCGANLHEDNDGPNVNGIYKSLDTQGPATRASPSIDTKMVDFGQKSQRCPMLTSTWMKSYETERGRVDHIVMKDEVDKNLIKISNYSPFKPPHWNISDWGKIARATHDCCMHPEFVGFEDITKGKEDDLPNKINVDWRTNHARQKDKGFNGPEAPDVLLQRFATVEEAYEAAAKYAMRRQKDSLWAMETDKAISLAFGDQQPENPELNEAMRQVRDTIDQRKSKMTPYRRTRLRQEQESRDFQEYKQNLATVTSQLVQEVEAKRVHGLRKQRAVEAAEAAKAVAKKPSTSSTMRPGQDVEWQRIAALTIHPFTSSTSHLGFPFSF